MADDVHPVAQTSPAVPLQPSLPASTAVPAVPPSGPPFSLTTLLRERLRSLLLGLLGGAVGAGAGLIVFFVLTTMYHQSGVPFGLAIWVAGGFLLGYLFHHPLAHLLRLPPRKERETHEAAGSRPPGGAAPDGARELIETVIFVIVLVLMLKSFDAEAFVIPTGSMAETLLGYQKWVMCPDCGYRFPANCSQQVDPSDGTPHWVSGCICPNCRQRIRFIPHDDFDLLGIIPISRTYRDPKTKETRGRPTASTRSPTPTGAAATASWCPSSPTICRRDGPIGSTWSFSNTPATATWRKATRGALPSRRRGRSRTACR